MQDKIDLIITRFDEMNARDPNLIIDGAKERPKELVHSERLVNWVAKLCPNASPALRLAAHSQHLMSWKSPRTDYPDTRGGYLQWRKDLLQSQAKRASKVLGEFKCDEKLVSELRKINLMKEVKTNADSQVMEDALSLSFFAHDFTEFLESYEDNKAVAIAQKRWQKMSTKARELLLQLPFSGRPQAIIARAIS